MRAILRFSLNGDNGTLTNKLRSILENRGLTLGSNTGTYDAQNISERQLGRALREFWLEVYQSQHQARVDHFWMYADRTALDDLDPQDDEDDE